MSDRRRGLGRGLGALIPSAPAAGRPSDLFFAEGDRSAVIELPGAAEGGVSGPAAGSGNDGGEGQLSAVPGARFAELPIDQIRANPRQPRSVFDEDELAGLEASIREVGILQPVVVSPVESDSSPGQSAWLTGDEQATVGYQLVMGERRLRAARAAGLTAIPAIIKDTADEVLLRDALLENLHRSQLNPLEEAAAYQQLLDDFGCTHEELAGRIGRSRPQITNTLRLLKLPALVQRRLASGVLSAGHARALLGLADAAAMERLAQRIVAEGLSVRTVEELVMLGESGEPLQRRPRQRTGRPELSEAAAAVSDRLDTRVSITMGRNKGRMSVEFASLEDLERILDLLDVRR